MRSQNLTMDRFAHYPPKAQAFVAENISILRQIPLPLLSILLTQIILYDFRFPAEQQTLVRQFKELTAMSSVELQKIVAGFAALELPSELADMNWIEEPRRFNERLSAMLWSTHQMDAYREAAHVYEERLAKALNGRDPERSRLAIVLIGNGVAQARYPLFRKLRQHGTMFTAVRPAGALDTLVQRVNARAQSYPQPYAHWYIDGGTPREDCAGTRQVTAISYEHLAPFAFQELNVLNHFVGSARPGSQVGPEEVQSFISSLKPSDIGLEKQLEDPVLRYFVTSIFAEGAGTQIFSTTFVQWSAREALRRAQPVTLLARFASRQTMAPMNVLLKRNPLVQEKDPEGSLIDADMGAYYTWINQTRLSGSDQSRFLVYFEGHEFALAISPSLARGTTSDSSVTMEQILKWME